MGQVPPRQMKVVFLGSWPPTPGISTYCVACVRSLAAFVYVHVLTFSHMYPDWLYPRGPVPNDVTFPKTDSPNVRVERRLAWYNPFGWIWSGLSVKGDLLHVQCWSLPLGPVLATVMLCFRLRGKRCVLTAHNLAGHDKRFAYRWMTALLIRLSHAVITHLRYPPEWFSKLAIRATGQAPIYVPHGVLDLYEESANRRPSDAPLLPEGARGILFFGAIRPYKGLDTLLEAFDLIADKIPDVHLIIAGRLWEPWDRYESLINERSWRDRVIFRLDYIPTAEVARYFDAADLVVLPYKKFESQSGVALSAAGMKKPMIVTNVGGLPNLQTDERYVVPPCDAPRLAAAIEKAMTTPGELARMKKVTEQTAAAHSWEEAAERMIEVYRNVLVSKKTRSEVL